jgi:hypothetical protein
LDLKLERISTQHGAAKFLTFFDEGSFAKYIHKQKMSIQSNDGYYADWKLSDNKSSLIFNVKAPGKVNYDWLGIGFSPVKSHQSSDMIVGFVSSAGPVVLDMYSNAIGFPVSEVIQSRTSQTLLL